MEIRIRLIGLGMIIIAVIAMAIFYPEQFGIMFFNFDLGDLLEYLWVLGGMSLIIIILIGLTLLIIGRGDGR